MDEIVGVLTSKVDHYEVVVCGPDGSGSQSWNEMPPEPDAEHPLRSFGNRTFFGTPWKGDWLADGFYWVTDDVARVETRVGTPDGNEPWRSAEPDNGFVYWGTWFKDGTYDADDEVWVEWRAFDTNGNLIDPALMPDQPQRLQTALPDKKSSGNSEAKNTDPEQENRLLFEIARDHLDPTGEHLRYSMPSTLYFDWRAAGDPGVGGVMFKARPRGDFTTGRYGDLASNAGCHALLDDECTRRDLGADGWAWIGENADGTIGVGLVRPDGNGVVVGIVPEHHGETPLSDPMGVTLDDAIVMATDPRLDSLDWYGSAPQLANRPTRASVWHGDRASEPARWLVRIDERTAAFTEYVAARRTYLRRIAYLLCGDWNDADDLVQTALEKLYGAWPRVDRKDPPDAYARQILVRATIDESRRLWRRREHATGSLPEVADEALPSVEDVDQLRAALTLLTPRERATIVLRYWADSSVAETARDLGCSVGTVKSQTARAITKLRAELGTPDRNVEERA